MNKQIIFCIIFFIAISFSFLSSVSASESDEEIKSLNKERMETLLYGIDTQVLELITILETEKNFEFNSDLQNLIENTSNSRLTESIINLFKISDDNSAVAFIFTELQENYNLSDDIIVSYINYITDYQTNEISEYFLELIEEESNAISIASIKALGKSNLENTVETLIKYLEDILFDDQRKPALIETLGKLKAEEALEILTDIATDIYTEKSSLRWKAVVALGEIGSEESLPILKSLFSDTDPYLRNYTISALKFFPIKDVEDLLIQGLKDSSWRVRVNAAQSLGDLGIKKAVPILIYKAENDPDTRNVRVAAVKSLGEIGGNTAYDFIRKLYTNNRSDSELRSISISILADKDLSNSIKTIKKVFDEEWDKDKSDILDYTCKVLSTTNSSNLKEFYVRMLSYDTNVNLKLYALRGIRINSLKSFKEEVETLTSEETARVIRKLAIDVLGDL